MKAKTESHQIDMGAVPHRHDKKQLEIQVHRYALSLDLRFCAAPY